MRISRRTSGGRGEYEISETAPGGVSPLDLIDRRLKVEFGDDWIADTGAFLKMQGGKPRIRLGRHAQIHPHLQVAAALMMPHPVRADEAFGRGLPILREKEYAIEHIDLGAVRLLDDGTAQIQIREIILRNASHDAEELNFPDRISKIQQLWAGAHSLPRKLAELVDLHRASVTSEYIRKDAEAVVARLQAATSESAADLGILYRPQHQDVLPDLIVALEAEEAPPEPPQLRIGEIDPDETEILRRTTREWKKWANSRGAASARFRQAVRSAYNSTCIVCGVHLPATSVNASAGVDAAHILPWADYDLDVVSNGVCLCKQHHWAFDEGLLEIVYLNGEYYVSVPKDVSRVPWKIEMA